MLPLTQNATAPLRPRASSRLISASAREKLHMPRRRYFHLFQPRSYSNSSYSHSSYSHSSSGHTPTYGHTPTWGPITVLDQWVAKEARPISLRQLMVFGRTLTESRLIRSANYVRTELPTRIAHRIRDMQKLPYVVVTNPHISQVYDLYYHAFDTFTRLREVETLEDNDRLCETIGSMLRAHLAVIPKLAMGVMECSGLMDSKELDTFMNTLLRARISRRVIAEQHIALTQAFQALSHAPGTRPSQTEFIGEVFLKCVAKDVIERCGKTIRSISQRTYGPDVPIPNIKIDGHLEANFPYILSHLEYIIGELLRNSVQAVVEKHEQRDNRDDGKPPPDIEVTICESAQHVIIRVSDQGGGIPRDIMPYLWSFRKGPASARLLENFGKVPKLAATMQELLADHPGHDDVISQETSLAKHSNSLASLSSRPPDLRLGMGLPLSRVYAEYWAGTLALHSLEGYGVDVFLQISKLGNKNEQLTTRASMDAV